MTTKTKKTPKPAVNNDNWKSIRGIDPELYQRDREDSVSHRMTVGEWLNSAIKSKLNGKQ
jgi:hypothetical protein